jgi:hypothetical protein
VTSIRALAADLVEVSSENLRVITSIENNEMGG